MEQKNIFNTLQKTPDYMILLYTKYLEGKENPDFTPLDYKQQIDAKADISKIVYLLSSNIWRQDARDNQTEKRAKALLRYVLISRLADYIKNDPLTVDKFRIQYNQEFRCERVIIVNNYNTHFRGDQGLKKQIYYNNPELREKWNILDKFIYKAFIKLHKRSPNEVENSLSTMADRLEKQIKQLQKYDYPCGCGGGYNDHAGKMNFFKRRHEETEQHQNYIKSKMTN